jgi:hypothetical protein
MKKPSLIYYSILFYSLMLVISKEIIADNSEIDNLTLVRFNIMAFSKSNEFLFQCIIVLLLVMIFGFAARLHYEKNINKE